MPPDALKAPRRFDVEHALTIDCDYVGMVAPAHLRNLDTTVPPVSACNLYAIARRPRVSINPQSFKSTVQAAQTCWPAKSLVAPVGATPRTSAA